MLVLVALSGLPGSGKSTLARALAARLGCALLELDRIEKPILARVSGDRVGWGGYESLASLADANLAIGTSVVLDCVGWTQAIRDGWREIASRHGARYAGVEVVCNDEVRLARVAARPERPPHVARAKELFEPWRGERVVVDGERVTDALVTEVLAHVA
jgi:predicted kinase